MAKEIVRNGNRGVFKDDATEEEIKEAAKTSITAEQMKKAKEYVAAGGDVKAIKTKYKLTATQEKELNEQSKNTKEVKK